MLYHGCDTIYLRIRARHADPGHPGPVVQRWKVAACATYLVGVGFIAGVCTHMLVSAH